ncbi:MAG: GAF domain-containing protein [Ardenticatenaceae bacterium]|nr:GAF domain-containing protein [Ardenticatenaceae bacterium]
MDDPKNKTFMGTIKQLAKRLEKLLFEPTASITDEQDRVRAYVSSILLFVVTLVFIFGLSRYDYGTPVAPGAPSWWTLFVSLLVTVGAYVLSRTKYYQWGLGLSFVPTVIILYGVVFDPPSQFSDVETLMRWVIVPLLVGGILLPTRALLVVSLVFIIEPILLIFVLPPEMTSDAISLAAFIIFAAILIALSSRFQARLQTQALAVLQAKNLAEKEGIIQQLQKAEALQQQRARIIEDSYEINSKLATILEPQKLVNEAVNLIQSLLNYNYVQFYLMDESEKTLALAGGTGQAGQELFSRGHTVAVEKGLVGQAATTNAPVLVSDVSEMDTWVANPLLPNTQSELAVPISVGDVVLGVLDVQEDRKDAFSEEDMALLQSVATAAALSLQNARLYALAQQSAKYEAVLNQINQQVVAAPNMERVLQVAAQTLGSSLNVRRATVQLSRRPGNGRFQEKN